MEGNGSIGRGLVGEEKKGCSGGGKQGAWEKRVFPLKDTPLGVGSNFAILSTAYLSVLRSDTSPGVKFFLTASKRENRKGPTMPFNF